MKKIFYKFFVLCAFVVTLTGCELYMDDRDIQLGEVVADGDGYSAPATYMDSISTVTYQFNENTVYINETYRPYIFSANVDTAAKAIEIRFAKSIPSNMLPQRGNCLASSLYDIFNANVCHKVDVVEEADGLYVVKGHFVMGREVYKHLVVEGSFYVQGDTTNTDNDSRAGENSLISGIKLRPINRDYTGRGDSIKAEEDEDGRFNFKFSLIEIGFNYLGAKGADYIKDNTKIGKSVNNFFKKKTKALKKKADSHKVKINAEMDGLIGFHDAVVIEVNFKFDFDNGSYDFHGKAYNELYAGFGFTSFKGSIVIPVIGNKTVNVLRKDKDNAIKEFKIGKFDYMFPCADYGYPIITSIGIFDFYMSPNLVAEFYATMSFKEPVGFFGKKITPIHEWGKHKDDKSEFSYGQGSHKTISESKNPNFLNVIDELETEDVKDGFYSIANLKHDFTIDLGVALTFFCEFGMTFDGFLNLYGQIGPTVDLHYVYDSSHLYKFDVNVPDPETGELVEDITNLSKSYFEFAVRAVLTLGGRIDAKIRTFDLFTAKATFDIIRTKYRYHPLNSPVVIYDKKRSNGNDAYFTAKITKYWDSEWEDIFNRFALPNEAPYLAIYKIKNSNKKWVDLTTSDLQYVCYVKSDESEYDIDDRDQTFNYDFKLENYEDCNYIAIPYYDTPFGYKYSYASLFKPDKPISSGEITNLEQVTIENGEELDGSQYYGFKFNVEGKGGRDDIGSTQWYVDIEITDKNSNSTTMATKYLGYFNEGEIRKYIFFFKGSSPSGYDLRVILWYRHDEEDENEVVDDKKIELSVWEGGETVVDMDDLARAWDSESTYKGYNLLDTSDNY